MLPQHWLFHPVTLCWLIAGLLLSWSVSLVVRAAVEHRDAKLFRQRHESSVSTPATPKPSRNGHAPNTRILRLKISLPIATWIAGFIAAVLAVGFVGIANAVADYISLSDNKAHGVPGGLFILAGGLVLGAIANIVWGFVGDRSRGRQRCPRCWYDMAATPRTPATKRDDKHVDKDDTPPLCTCPECGEEVFREKELLRARKQRWKISLGVLLLLLSFGSYLGDKYQRGGVVAMVPTWVLILGAPILPDHWFENRNWTIDDEYSLVSRIDEHRFWLPHTGMFRWRIESMLFSEDPETLVRVSRFFALRLIDKQWLRRTTKQALADALNPTLSDRRRTQAIRTLSNLLYFNVTVRSYLNDDLKRVSSTNNDAMVSQFAFPKAYALWAFLHVSANDDSSKTPGTPPDIDSAIQDLTSGGPDRRDRAAWEIAANCLQTDEGLETLIQLLSNDLIPEKAHTSC